MKFQKKAKILKNMKLGNLSFVISVLLIFFDFTYLGSQEKVNLQDLQPTFEE